MKFNPFVILLIRFFELSADYVKTFAIPLLVFTLSNSISLSGLAFFLELLPRTFLSPIMGGLADRFNLRRQLLFIDCARAALALALLIFFTHNLYWIFIFSGMISLFSGYSFVAIETLSGKALSHEKYSSYQARFQMIEPMSRVIGPALGAFLLNWLTLKQLILIVLVLYLISLTLRFTGLYENQKSLVLKKLNPFQDLMTGFKITFNNKTILSLTLCGMSINFLFGILQSTMPALVTKSFILPNKYFALPSIMAGGAAFLGIFIVPELNKRLSVNFVGKTGLLMVFFSLFLLSNTISFYLFCIGYSALVLGMSLYTVFFRSKRLEEVPKEDYGKVVGVSVFLLFLALPLSGIITYAVGNIFSPAQLILFASVVCVSFNILCYLLMQATNGKNYAGYFWPF